MSTDQARAVMVMGTGSGVGKSFLTAGLCRLFRERGLRVAPFKAQNMSNNSYVTREGQEMGRAQAVQAECAGLEPSVHMNPILLKPAADNASQVVVQGKALGTFRAREYYGLKEKLWAAICESYQRLATNFDVMVIEGAGSPAEINLKDFDMVNFRVAELSDAACLLVGDIDKGGVFASLWGTLALLDESERGRIAGLVINKFRGDRSLLEPGLRTLENLTGKKVLGVLPYEPDLWIEEEDAVDLEKRSGPVSPMTLDIAVLLFPRISNATDFQILAREPSVSVRGVRRLEEFGQPDLLILPGTKATQADLQYLKDRGLAAKIQDYARKGGRVLGICGGFQMLGESIEDPEAVESEKGTTQGLSLLPLRTRFYPEKVLRQVRGRIRRELFSQEVRGELEGYEIHMGQSDLGAGAPPFFEVQGLEEEEAWRPEGVVDTTGRILGTYLHGIFDSQSFRTAFLDALWKSSGKVRPEKLDALLSSREVKENNYARLGQLLKNNLDPDFLETCLRSSLLSR